MLSESRQVNGGTATTATYSYDKTGNRLSMATTGLPSVSYSYNELDQLTSTQSGSVTSQYGYDRRGNLKQLTSGSNITSYTWDAADRLVGAVMPGGGTASYTYDHDNRRVKQTATTAGGTDNRHYLWNETSAYGDVLLETDALGAIQTSYVLGAACSLCDLSGLVSQKKNSAVNFFLKDGQGSVRSLTDSSGNFVSGQSYNYDAFGKLSSGQATPASSYLYTGQQFDVLTGLYSLRARYYNPGEGRFLSRDTYTMNMRNPIELNRYTYVANNPINFSDPSGYTMAESGPLNFMPQATSTPNLAVLGYTSLRHLAVLGIAALVIAIKVTKPCVKLVGIGALALGDILCLGLARARIDSTTGLAKDAIQPFDELRRSPGITTYNDVYGDASPPPWFAPRMLILMSVAARIIFDVRGLEPEDAWGSVEWKGFDLGIMPKDGINPNTGRYGGYTSFELCQVMINPAFRVKTTFKNDSTGRFSNTIWRGCL